MAEQIFPKGVRVFDPHAKAPGFVKGSIVITLNELVQFCKDNPDYLSEYNGQKQLRLQITEKKQGGLMITVDTYKKETAAKDDLPF